MSQLLNLPNIDGHRFFVVSECVRAKYAKHLTIGWLQSIRKCNPKKPISFILFSYPKEHLDKCLEDSALTNIDVRDYFSVRCKSSEFDVLTAVTDFVNQNPNSVLIIDCISTLQMYVGSVPTLRFIEKLQQNHKAQIFILHKKNFCGYTPRLQTLSDTFVLLNKADKKIASKTDVLYEVSVIHRKPGGGIVQLKELVYQNIKNYNFMLAKDVDISTLNVKQKRVPEVKMEPESSFRIILSDKEIKQRDSVPLPYLQSSNSDNRESKIIYVPDDADDLDEEDPDYDLDV